MKVLAVTKSIAIEGTTCIEWHEATRFRGKTIACGGWVIFTSQLLGSEFDRLAVVHGIYRARGRWCIFLNVFPPTSLVTLAAGQRASMDESIVSMKPVASQQLYCELCEREFELMYPVEPLPLAHSSKMLYFVPR